jgi:hypothetical protein
VIYAGADLELEVRAPTGTLGVLAATDFIF